MKKKLITICMAICMLFTIGFSSNAASRISGTYSATPNHMTYNGSQTVSGDCKYYYLRLDSVSFNGLPTNTFVSNSYVHLSICKNNSEVASRNFTSRYGYTGSYSQSSGTYQLGVSSNAGVGFTCGAKWNAQEVL